MPDATVPHPSMTHTKPRSPLLLQSACFAAEDVAEIREKGIRALKESESNPRSIVEAARAFLKAADLYTAAGNDEQATEMNSFLYWCKKKMTLQDIEQFTKSGNTAIVEKLEAVEKIAPKADEAQKWFDRAEKYAKDNPNEHYLIAVRFFEVASRFIGTKESIAAQERSLKEQGLSVAKAGAVKPAPDKSAAAKAGKPINLLAMIDLSKDVVSGKWGYNGTVLTGDKGEGCRIEIPYQPPEEYDFKVVFMRVEGKNGVEQILRKGDRGFVWVIDGWGTVASGIDYIGGKGGDSNPTTFKGTLITNNRWHTSIVQVRNSEVTVLFDGKPIVKYATDYTNFAAYKGWKLRDQTVLGIGHELNNIGFSVIELIEITGTGKKTR